MAVREYARCEPPLQADRLDQTDDRDAWNRLSGIALAWSLVPRKQQGFGCRIWTMTTIASWYLTTNRNH